MTHETAILTGFFTAVLIFQALHLSLEHTGSHSRLYRCLTVLQSLVISVGLIAAGYAIRGA